MELVCTSGMCQSCRVVVRIIRVGELARGRYLRCIGEKIWEYR